MIYDVLQELINYGIKNNLIEKEDEIVVRNQLIDTIGLESWENPEKISETRSIQKILDDIIEYFNRNDLGTLEALDLEFMIEITKSDDIDNIKLLSQYMFLKNGGKAQLTVGNNEEYVLPIIGELKNIMNELEDELSKSIRIKDALEQFIYEKEETTDYPWIEVLFLDSEGIKTRNNHVKFTFNYMNKKYSLINIILFVIYFGFLIYLGILR